MSKSRLAVEKERQAGTKKPFSTPSPIIGATQPLLERMEKITGYPIVAYWSGPRGPIRQRTVTSMSRLLQNGRPHRQIGLFLRTSGGECEAALRLVHVLRCHCRRLTVFLPFICASSGTLVALGADEILMGPGAYLTPVDSALDHPLCPRNPLREQETVSISQDQFRRALRLWREADGDGNPFPELYKYIHPVVIGELDRSDALSLRICQELLSYHVPNAKTAQKIGKALCFGFPSHSYPIVLREAQRIGLKAKPLAGDLDGHLRDLDAIYSRFATHVCKYRDENNYHSAYVPFVLERLGMQVYEHHHAEMKYKRDLKRWDRLGRC